MRHLDGFTIELRRTDGTKFTEYTNPDEKRHAEFLGAFGSRIINANDGEELTVMLKFEQNFRLHNAHGVYICIGLGEAQGPLSRADNAQVFWLPKEHIVLGREYKVREFHLWEKPESHEPTSHLPLRVPAPAPDPSPANASAEWLIDDTWLIPNPGCVAVEVARHCKDTGDLVEQHVTFPPESWKNIETDWPRVWHPGWLKRLNGYKGHEHIFEFRNVGPYGEVMKQRLDEAASAFGLECEEISDDGGATLENEDDAQFCSKADTDYKPGCRWSEEKRPRKKARRQGTVERSSQRLFNSPSHRLNMACGTSCTPPPTSAQSPPADEEEDFYNATPRPPTAKPSRRGKKTVRRRKKPSPSSKFSYFGIEDGDDEEVLPAPGCIRTEEPDNDGLLQPPSDIPQPIPPAQSSAHRDSLALVRSQYVPIIDLTGDDDDAALGRAHHRQISEQPYNVYGPQNIKRESASRSPPDHIDPAQGVRIKSEYPSPTTAGINRSNNSDEQARMHTESATQSGRYAGSEGTTPATTVSQRDISEAEDVDEEYRLDVEEARIERRFDRTVIASRRRLLERTRSKNARV